MNNEYEGQWGPPPAQPYFFAAPPEIDRTLKEASHIKGQAGHPSECKAFLLSPASFNAAFAACFSLIRWASLQSVILCLRDMLIL